MKFKKIISAVLTAAMVLGMSAMSASASEAKFVPTEDGTYTSTMVEAYNYYSPDQYSMCNGVFAGEIDVTIEGEWADLTLYVCNPTPKWGGADAGVLGDPVITYEGVEYTGTITSVGSVDENAAQKLFTQEGSFFGIELGATYAVDTIEFTIPTVALASNIDIKATVNLVMYSEQSFWLGITYAEVDTDTDADTDVDTDVDTTDSREVPVFATVSTNESTYTVTVPEDITFGELDNAVDTTVNYTVSVSNFVKGNDDLSVEITSGNGQIVDGENAISFTNSFGTQTVSENASLAGTLTVKAADVASAPAGDYEGTVTFAISTVK